MMGAIPSPWKPAITYTTHVELTNRCRSDHHLANNLRMQFVFALVEVLFCDFVPLFSFSAEGGEERIERQFEKPDRERERERDRDRDRERERERDRERDEGRDRDRRKQRREDIAPYTKSKRGNVYISII